MTTNNSHFGLHGVSALDFRDKGRRTNNIECGYTVHATRVKSIGLLKGFGDDGDR
jgi:hypothetical protein